MRERGSSEAVGDRASGYKARRARARMAHRAMLEARTARPVSEALRRHDPLAKGDDLGWMKVLVVALLCFGAVALHIIVIVVFFGLSGLFTGEALADEPRKLQVEIVEPPEPPPEPEIKVEEPEAPKEPEVPEEPEEPKIKPKAPPPDPIDKPKEPPKEEPPPEPVRRRVGVNLESTVEGGDGPSFNAGNTRMGETDLKANDPKDVEKIPPGDTGGTPGAKSGEQPTGNTVARRLPGSSYTKAGLSGGQVIPVYPNGLKRRNIEGDVKLMVTIGLSGEVTDVKVLKGSGHAEMDTAAISAARQQRWTPARKDGEPVVTTQSYTVRFRIKDQ